MFAGPNGSGKSTIKSVVPQALLGVYVNPDDMLKVILDRGFLDLHDFGITATATEAVSFFSASTLLRQAGLADKAASLRFTDGKLDFTAVQANAYFASVAADFVRQRLIAQRTSFSFETVMSSPDKVAVLAKAQAMGYRTYLYFIATDDPAINIARVQTRVLQGGHDVPVDKIVSRYARSLDLLLAAIRHTHRAYLFDNSQHNGNCLWVAEVTDGRELVMHANPMPRWFQHAVWDKIQGAAIKPDPHV